MPEYDNQTKVFMAFCDVHRLQILERLRGGEKCACDLLEGLNIRQPSLSYHMKKLCESGIVESRQDGKWTYYKISDTGSAKAMELLKAITTPNTTAENCCCNK